MTGADAAGEIQLGINDIFPDFIDCRDITGITGHGRNIRHAAVHISGPNRVPDCLILLGDGFMLLGISPFVFDPAPIQKPLGLFQVRLVAGCPIQLD